MEPIHTQRVSAGEQRSARVWIAADQKEGQNEEREEEEGRGTMQTREAREKGREGKEKRERDRNGMTVRLSLYMADERSEKARRVRWVVRRPRGGQQQRGRRMRERT